MAPASKVEDGVRYFLRGLFFMKDHVKKHITHARASQISCRSMILRILSCLENEHYDISSGKTSFDDSSFDVGCVILSRYVLLLPVYNAAPSWDSMSTPKFYKMQRASLSRSIRNSKPSP